MGDLVAFAVAALLAGFGVARLPRAARRGADPVQRYVCAFALCLGVSRVLLDPLVLTALDRLTHRPLADVVCGDSLTLLAIGCLTLLAASLAASPPTAAGPPRRGELPVVRRHLATAVLIVAASAALACAAGPVMRDGEMTVAGTGRWMLAAHDALFACYAVGGLLQLSRVLARNARHATAGLLRFGLQLTTAATAVGVVWTAWSLDDVVDVLSGGAQAGGEDAVSGVLGAVCTVLAVGGATVMLWGSPLGAPVRWLRAHRRHRALEPLWSALHAAVPEIALVGPAEPEPGWGVRRAEFALYRRIIEIHDGRLALRPYLDPRVPEWAGRSAAAGPPDPAVVEAATIAAALEHRAAGRAITLPDGPAVPQPAQAVAGTVDAETAWLLRVTSAFTGSPVVAGARHRARAGVPR